MQNQIPQTPELKPEKKRHGCFTAWLALAIMLNLLFIILYLGGAGTSISPKGNPGWAVPSLILLLILNLVCVLALFKWKKWGFWGFCAVNVIGLFVDIGLDINLVWPVTQIAFGIVVLYVALNIGKEDKGWPQLE